MKGMVIKMYNPKSLKADEFISDEEITETLAYADAHKDDMELIDSLIEKAFEEKDLGARSTILADAEKILMNEMPVMPLVQYKNCYVKSKDLSGLSVSYYGAVNFRDAKLKNADDYTATEPTEEE